MAKKTELEERCKDAEKEYYDYIQEAQQAINDARQAKIDPIDVSDDVATVKADKRDWILGKISIKDRLRKLLG